MCEIAEGIDSATTQRWHPVRCRPGGMNWDAMGKLIGWLPGAAVGGVAGTAAAIGLWGLESTPCRSALGQGPPVLPSGQRCITGTEYLMLFGTTHTSAVSFVAMFAAIGMIVGIAVGGVVHLYRQHTASV